MEGEQTQQTNSTTPPPKPPRARKRATAPASEGDSTSKLAQELHDSQTKKDGETQTETPLAGTGLSVEDKGKGKKSKKDEPNLDGLDTRPQQPFLGDKNSQKLGMAPNVPPEVMDAAHAVVNARADWDRAAVKYHKAAETFMHRADNAKLRMVRVNADVVLRLERPESRLKMDGYKKPVSERAQKPKKEKPAKAAKAKPEKKAKPAKKKAPTKKERESAAKASADAQQKERLSKKKSAAAPSSSKVTPIRPVPKSESARKKKK